MKKLICLILAFSLCLSIAACGGSSGPQAPTEPDNWTVDTQYVTDIMNQFMASEDYQKMVSDFETGFHDVNAKLIVQKPYVDAAIEYYMDDPACHLLILLVRGNFCWDDSYTDALKIVYDMDSGRFYDGMVGGVSSAPTRYPELSGTVIESLLCRPTEIYTTALGSEPLHTQFEVYHALSAEEVIAVNNALGVEEPKEGIVYEKLPPAEPENWVIDPQYVADRVTGFMDTAGYQRMVDEFERAFRPDYGTLIVRKPYVDAAIEHYVEPDNTHLLILALRGDFGFDNRLVLVYDLDTDLFFDRISESAPEQAAQYAAYEGNTQTMITAMPYETFVNLEDGTLLWIDTESYRMLNADELAEVNRILGVEEPSDDILCVFPTEGELAEAPAEDVPVEETPAEMPVTDTPAKPSGEVTVNAQAVADAARNFQSDKWYQDIASDPNSIRIGAAFEYSLEDFNGHNVHVLVVRAEGIDTDMWGFTADTFLVDIENGMLYHEGNLDMNNWGAFASIEECFSAILCTPVWEQAHIWSDMEARTELPQSMIDEANASLS